MLTWWLPGCITWSQYMYIHECHIFYVLYGGPQGIIGDRLNVLLLINK